MTSFVLMLTAFASARLVAPDAPPGDVLPDVPLASPWFAGPQEVVIAANGKPALVFPVSPTSGLARLDFIQAVRCVQPKFKDRLGLVVVLVNVKQLSREAAVEFANDLAALWAVGFHGAPDVTVLKDDTGEWYRGLGEPDLPHTMLVDGQRRIRLRAILYGPLEWELARIAAVLDDKPLPEAPRSPEEADPSTQHPFYQAVLEASPVEEAAEQLAAAPPLRTHAAFRQTIWTNLQWPDMVRAMNKIDPVEANRVLKAYAEKATEFDGARLAAEAVLQVFDKKDCAWAQAIVDARPSGSISAEVDHRMIGSIDIENPADSIDMRIEVKSTLSSEWDHRVIHTSEHTIDVGPGSAGHVQFKEFRNHNAGWGEYLATHEISVTMSTGYFPNIHECPPFKRRIEQRFVFAPRMEFAEQPAATPSAAGTADRAFSLALFALRKPLALALFEAEDRSAEPTSKPGATSEPDPPGPTVLLDQPSPPITLKRWIQGGDAFHDALQLDVDALSGKVVLLDFMFTECPPCRAAIKGLTELQEKHGPDGLAVISLCTDWGSEGLARLVDRLGVRHSVGSDFSGPVDWTFGVGAHRKRKSSL